MGDLGKLIVAKGIKKLPKVQKIAQSGHTGGKLIKALLQVFDECGFAHQYISQCCLQIEIFSLQFPLIKVPR